MRKRILFSILFFIVFKAFTQVGIGTTTPDGSAVLDVSSTDKGFLLPRMTTSQRDAVVNPAKGLAIYNLNENCLQINSGTSSSPDWACVGTDVAIIANDCGLNGFEGTYANGISLTASNKFSLTLTNSSFFTATIGFEIGDLVLSGVSGVNVVSVSPSSGTIPSGGSLIVEYTLGGTPTSAGDLTAVWTKLSLNCTKVVSVLSGDATFSLPHSLTVVGVNDPSTSTSIAGIIDNGSRKLTINVPYTGGAGTYEAYTGEYVLNNPSAADQGDVNRFRIKYPSGTFLPSGRIPVTIEVDGDGAFYAERQLWAIQKTIASLDFKVNGQSKGNLNLVVSGGILDRAFSDSEHKFVYLPVLAADGNYWLNHNLGARYTNRNDGGTFNPTQQATAFNDSYAYGSLYQWGRYSDGHELIYHPSPNSGTPNNGAVNINSSSNTPATSHFIYEENFPYDWRVPGNSNLWQGVSEVSVNNPCPEGYRLPTKAEMASMLSAEGITNKVTAANSSLALTAAGYRDNETSIVGEFSNGGHYWTKSIQALSYSSYLNIGSGGHLFLPGRRSSAYSVRCIHDRI